MEGLWEETETFSFPLLIWEILILKNIPYTQNCISFNAYMNFLSYYFWLMPRRDDGTTTDLIRLDL